MNVIINKQALGHRGSGRLEVAKRIAHLDVRFATIKKINKNTINLIDTFGKNYEIPKKNFNTNVSKVIHNMVVIQFDRIRNDWKAVRNETDKPVLP